VTFTGDYDSALLSHESEINLIKQLARFPDEMTIVLESLEPRVIANYLQALATSFHKFYGDCKVISDDIELSQARIALVIASKNILAEGLKILGIQAPHRM
jgi:arginyl-tRNA synthetase